MALVAVEDPKVLAQLGGASAGLKPVTDERVLFELQNGGDSLPQKLVRQVGLTARYGVEGLTALPNMVGDALGLGSSQTVSDLLTKMGLPQPQGAQERVVGDITRAMAGQGGLAKVGSMAASPTVQALLASNPGAQIVGAGGGAAASGATREAGGGPVAQTVAGLAGGIAAPIAGDLVVQGGKALTKGLVAATRPFTASGREQVVGETLRRASTDPQRTVANLADAPELVPGSQPTTAQAARDPGLLTAERALRAGPTGGRFAERGSQQNQARNILLNDLAKDEAALATAKGTRAGTAGGLYEAARREGIDTEMATALKPQIDNLMQRMPKGVLEKAKELARLNGEKFDSAGSVNGLHWMKLAVDDAIEGAAVTGVGKQTKSGLVQFKDDLLTVIDEVSPKYGEARKSFADLSRPVNQLEAMQDVRGRVLNAGTDAVTGERIMSPAKFFQAVTRNEGDLAKVLTPEQMGKLKGIAADLERGALSETAGKAPGSNTYQNLSTAYVLGQALGGKSPDSPLMQNLMRPLAWMNKLNEPALMELLTDAMLDPVIARTLMGRTSPRAVESVALELQQRAKALGLGGALGTAQTVGASQSRPSATPDRQQGR